MFLPAPPRIDRDEVEQAVLIGALVALAGALISWGVEIAKEKLMPKGATNDTEV